MAGMPFVIVMFGLSLIPGIVFAVVVYRRVKTTLSEVGGIEGLKQALQQAKVDHPSQAFPVALPTAEVRSPRILLIIVLCIAVLSCSIGGYIQYRMLRKSWLLAREGEVTMATVTEKRIVVDDEGSDDTYYVIYTFVASSGSGQPEEVQRKERVSYQQFIRVREPGQVEVIYAHSDPKVAQIAAHYVPGKVSYLPIIVSGIIILIDVLIALPWTYRQFQNASRLEIEGVPGTATLLDLYEDLDSDSSSYYVAYALPDGQQIRHSVSRKVYETLKIGDVIRIIYLFDNPAIFRPEWD